MDPLPFGFLLEDCAKQGPRIFALSCSTKGIYLLLLHFLGTRSWNTAQYHPHPRKDAKRQQFPQHFAWTRECMDQVHPVRNETHPRCHLWNGLAGDQLLAEFGEGIGEHRNTTEERRGEHGHGLPAKCEAFPCHCQFYCRHWAEGCYRFRYVSLLLRQPLLIYT